MRIAQVAPLDLPVHPQGHGGIETAVGILTNVLVDRGHQVTLFARAESQTLASLESTAVAVQTAQGADPQAAIAAAQAEQWDSIRALACHFDVIHFHGVEPPFELVETLDLPTLYTLYGSFNPKTYHRSTRYRTHNFVSISDTQRQGGPALNYIRTIYNGVHLDDYPFNPQMPLASVVNEDAVAAPEPIVPRSLYLAFLGRMSPHKGPQLAIEVAKRAGLPLKLAGRIEDCDRTFFEAEIVPHLDGQFIDYWGEVDHLGKCSLLSNACATLFPLTLDQPFGQVMVESMAVGTPVIATRLGAAAEIIVRGKTGFICDSLDQMVEAVLKTEELKRQDCRDLVVRHFSDQPMVERYEAAYGQVLEAWQSRRRSAYQAAVVLRERSLTVAL